MTAGNEATRVDSFIINDDIGTIYITSYRSNWYRVCTYENAANAPIAPPLYDYMSIQNVLRAIINRHMPLLRQSKLHMAIFSLAHLILDITSAIADRPWTMAETLHTLFRMPVATGTLTIDATQMS